ncbi:hypothetical protein HHK36_000624 [Tetracentron sinense]|uniref:RCC1-like domain-containing protein n=1 Tax=Tetracentron sinense TaxID=13715 RepID=A0A835A1C7_TETSI|nr:hypothetical protein HHK36_000624 [Tetracentron sinense]
MAHRLRCAPLARYISSASSPSTSKIPLLWNTETESADAITTVQLLSWGRGSSGQLGGATEEIRLYPSPVASLILPSKFHLCPFPGRLPPSNPPDIAASPPSVEVGISCGLFHSSILIDGKLWIWGKGDGGRLGFGHENPATVPTLNPNLDCIQSIALGGLHSIALTALGEVFTWGYGGFGALGHSVYHRELLPRMVKGVGNEKICHIATGGTHTAAITDLGLAFHDKLDDEGDGRLGLGAVRGPNEGALSIPSKVKALPVPVAAVSCGGFFTMALTKEGQLWNWGANSNYELGRGDKGGGWKPQAIPSLQDVHFIQIASGGYHSLALTDEGKVLSWGHGGHGQLGHYSNQNQKVPIVVEALAEERIVYIACGGSSSAAITDKGKLYMWGNAKDCQLGVPGLPEIQPFPVEVKFLTEDDGLGPHHVLSVSIGASHAMCLVSRPFLDVPQNAGGTSSCISGTIGIESF